MVMVDFEAARRDPVAFAELVGRNLTDRQAEAIRAPVLGEGPQTVAICAPRQSGKSRTLAVAAAWAAIRSRDVRVLIVSAAEDAAKRLLAEVREALTCPVLAGSVVEETTALVKLTNGSEVRSVSASERAVRGWSADLLILDEAALLDDGLIQGAALPTVAATGGRVLMASSAGPARGHFYNVVMAAEAGSRSVRAIRWKLADAPWISASTVAMMRESMSDLRARAELDGEFAGGGDLLLGDLVNRAVADVRVPGLAGLAKGAARVWAGVDWAASAGGDHSAMVALARAPEAGERRFIVAAAHAWPSGHPLVGDDGVIGEIANGGVPLARVTAERNGLGEACAQELYRRLHERPVLRSGYRDAVLERRQWKDVDGEDDWGAVDAQEARHPASVSTAFYPVYTSQEMKAVTFSALRLLIERGALIIPASFSELIRELTLLRVELTASGGERIEASAGHDDLAHALAFALAPVKARDGRWRVGLSALADPAAEVPPVRAMEREGVELTRTGGGVELPRVPVLQSMDGGELTDPKAGSRERSPAAALADRVQAAVDQHHERTFR
jgi:hypothetical protein